jgi:dihydrofolate reductase
MSAVALVLAMADNGVIGNKGKIPWRIADDMRRFKRLTMGKPIVMGRKTWESLPKKPLPGRTNIVITRDRTFAPPGAVVVYSLEEALARAEEEGPDEIMIVGGAEIYQAVLPRADRIHLTEVRTHPDGDAHMPKFDASVWRETTREDHTTEAGLRYSYVTLERN